VHSHLRGGGLGTLQPADRCWRPDRRPDWRPGRAVRRRRRARCPDFEPPGHHRCGFPRGAAGRARR